MAGITIMSLRLSIRRLIGRKGVKIIRSISSSIGKHVFKLKGPNAYRPFGISAVVWSKNEEDWIEISMRSVADIVDEYVLIDSSTDRTPEIAMETGRELGIPVKIIRTPTKNMAEVGNLGLKHSSYRWILKWDPDFILHENYIETLQKLVKELDENDWYYAIYWPHICLDGDLYHYDPNKYLHIEHWLFNYHPKLKYEMAGWLEILILPLFYKRIDIDKPMSFHLRTVKNPIRLLYRKYWYKARKEGILDKIDLETYVREKIVQDYGTSDIEEAALMFLKEKLSKLSRYDPENILSYPRILKEYVKRKYGINL